MTNDTLLIRRFADLRRTDITNVYRINIGLEYVKVALSVGVQALARGMARIAAAHHPNPVIVRMSDCKTNEHAQLIGGAPLEPKEADPMLGWRGASRYYSEGYREGFDLERRAVAQAERECDARDGMSGQAAREATV